MRQGVAILSRILALCIAAYLSTGCAALGFAPIASVANFGYAAWTGSRLRFVEDAGFDRVTMAAERALIGLDLQVELTSELKRKGEVRVRVYQIRSERGDLAILRLVRLTPTMTDLTLDVGIMGNRPAGELIADHIRWYTDGDTIRAARRAAIESFAELIDPDGANPGASEATEGSEPAPVGPDFGKGLF
ncbi:MAG: hypothetical protein RIE77_14920 [Phycisphaerales bacterium]|jgi:hypothetical protein